MIVKIYCKGIGLEIVSWFSYGVRMASNVNLYVLLLSLGFVGVVYLGSDLVFMQ